MILWHLWFHQSEWCCRTELCPSTAGVRSLWPVVTMFYCEFLDENPTGALIIQVIFQRSACEADRSPVFYSQLVWKNSGRLIQLKTKTTLKFQHFLSYWISQPNKYRITAKIHTKSACNRSRQKIWRREAGNKKPAFDPCIFVLIHEFMLAVSYFVRGIRIS